VGRINTAKVDHLLDQLRQCTTEKTLRPAVTCPALWTEEVVQADVVELDLGSILCPSLLKISEEAMRYREVA